MKELKICVYAICKNESKFVNRFMDAVQEAEKVYILDTGSDDNTAELFRKRGAIVHEKKYNPFHFDEARNDSLSYVPEDVDVCICLDIDDVIKPGFIKSIKETWKENTSQMSYEYICETDENGGTVLSFYNNHIHSRKNFHWEYPIHEVLIYTGDDFHLEQNDEIKLYHKPDLEKSRAFYMDLLEERVTNVPDDFRNIMILTGEYVVRQQYEKAINLGKHYLRIKGNNYSGGKSKIMYYIAKSYRGLKDFETAKKWAILSAKELPQNIDSYVELMMTCYELQEFDKTIQYGKKALSMPEKNYGVVNESICFDGTVEDYIALAYGQLGDNKNALIYVEKALEKKPNDERLLKNKQYYEQKIKEKELEN